MTPLKSTTITKSSPNTKMTPATSIVKKPLLTLKKPSDKDTGLVKKTNTTPSPLKGKVVLATTSKSPSKIERSPLKTPAMIERSPLKAPAMKVTSSISTVTKTLSPVAKKSVNASPITGPTTKPIIREKLTKSDPTKSVVLQTPERKQSPEVKKEPVRSVVKSPPVRVAKPSSPKSTVVAPAKSVLSPIKSVSPSPKSNVMVRSTPEKVKEIKPATKPKKLVASPVKPPTVVKTTKPSVISKTEVKPKLTIKKTPISSPRVSRTGLTLKITPLKINSAITSTPGVIVDELVTPEVVQKTDSHPCCGAMTDNRDDFNDRTPSIDECAIDNDFNLAGAFKIAEQLIRIQGVDEGLETIEKKNENSTVNWEDIIVPCGVDIDSSNVAKRDIQFPKITDTLENAECENFIVRIDDASKTSIETAEDQNECTCLLQNQFTSFSFVTNENHTTDDSNDRSIDKLDDSIELDNSVDFSNTVKQDIPIPVFQNANENVKNFIVQIDDRSTDTECSQSESIRNHQNDLTSSNIDLSTSTNENYSTNDSCYDPMDNLSDYVQSDNSIDEENSSVNHTSEDQKDNQQWTIVIDEFSLDIAKKENQPPIVEDTCEDTFALSYADVLKKKMPKVLANSTNSQNCKMPVKPKLSVTMQIKEYQMLKKVEALYSTNIFFHSDQLADDENDYDAFQFDESECRASRRKNNSKKIKYFSKRHFKNTCRDYEYVEEQSDVFIMPVWKNIY